MSQATVLVQEETAIGKGNNLTSRRKVFIPLRGFLIDM
jgi:hypothetical protein